MKTDLPPLPCNKFAKIRFGARLMALLALACLSLASTHAQIHEKGFNFQGYARDFEGTALGNKEITVKFSIYPEGGSAVFIEEQTVSTDPYGVFTATIGEVNTAGFFSINWANDDYWLKVEVRAFGGDFVVISDQALASVPYAQAAANGVPPGTIIPFAGPLANIPNGYVACDGSSYNPTDPQYKKLYDAVGFAWGKEGSNFRVPDLRGYFLRGWDGDANRDEDKASRTALYSGGESGNSVGSYQVDQTKSHNHGGTTSTDGNHSHGSNSTDRLGFAARIFNSTPGSLDNTGDEISAYITTKLVIEQAGDHSHTISNDGGSESRPENASVLYIIKL